jgi:hypothetical protein
LPGARYFNELMLVCALAVLGLSDLFFGTSLRERARSVGGELRITSIPGRGSEVEAVL